MSLSGRKDEYHIGIIGGSGYIGSSLARHLSSRFNVTILDRKPPEHDFGGSFMTCDIRNLSSLVKNLDNLDLVINTAIVQIPEINRDKRLGYEVNVLGIQNLCQAVESSTSVKGLLHTSSWHVFGETDLRGIIDEGFGYHPDKIDQRARFYALCKIAQETTIRLTSEMSSKSYGVVRLGTVLGERMPEQTAANIFIRNALKGEPITPFAHTQHRPMLYVDIQDVCKGFENFTQRILEDETSNRSITTVNLIAPYPITIIELARIVRKNVLKFSRMRIKPRIEVIDKGTKSLYSTADKQLLKVDITKARKFLGLRKLRDPETTIENLVKERVQSLR